MADALEDHEGTVSIGNRTITNVRFADNIDGLTGQEQELIKLINHIEEAFTAYGMQISAKKTQLMTNNTAVISTDITIDNKKLETLRSSKYLGAIVSDQRSKPEAPVHDSPDHSCSGQTKNHLERQEQGPRSD